MCANYVLGVDSGATKTCCAVVNNNGAVLGFGMAGSSSHYSVDIKTAKENLNAAIKQAVNSSGLQDVMLDVGCFGISGLDTKLDHELYTNFISSMQIAKKYVLVGDQIIAHYAVTKGEPGIVVIAGSGSISYGVNAIGKDATAGGWEWLVGDEGSAFDIGRSGLIAAIKAYDGREESTILTRMFQKHFNVSDFRGIYQKVYDSIKKGKLEISSLSPIITSAALKGDKVAVNILKESANELGSAAIAVAKKLNMENEPVIIGVVGGVFKSGVIILEEFKRKVKTCVPMAIFKPPIEDAIIGAIFLGLKEIGVSLDMKLENKIKQNIDKVKFPHK